MLAIVTEFVIEMLRLIEIGMEQTRLLQCTLFHYVDRRTIFVTEIVIDYSDRAVLVLNISD